MGRPPARIDVLTSVTGVRFAEAWPNRVATDFDGAPAHLISRRDLLANKRALGRLQDQMDAENLIKAESIAQKRRNTERPE